MNFKTENLTFGTVDWSTLHRRWRQIGAVSVLALCVACGSSEKKDNNDNKNVKKVETVSPADLDDIKNHIGHLSNNNKRERWREGLIKLGQKSTVVRKKVIELLIKNYNDSLSGASYELTAGGRARAVYVLGKLGAPKDKKSKGDAGANAVVKKALRDPAPEVRAAAAQIYAGRGDDSVLKDLLASAKDLSGEAGDQLVSSLNGFATAKNRALFLAALTFQNLNKMAPVVDKTMPKGSRASECRKIVRSHKNAAAVAYAIRRLVKDRQASAMADIRKAQARLSSANLRKEVFRAQDYFASSSQEQSKALAYYLGLLKANPKDAVDIAKRVRALGSKQAIEGLAAIAEKSRNPEALRVVVLKVLGGLKQTPSPKDKDLKALVVAARPGVRASLNAGGETTRAAVQAIGEIGAPESDTDPLVEILNQEGKRAKYGKDLVRALNRLGGETAAGQLVSFLKKDASLRAVIQAELSKNNAKKLPLFDLVDCLKDSSVDVRRAAFEILKKTTGETFRYKPDADPSDREEAFEKWEGHVRDLKGG